MSSEFHFGVGRGRLSQARSKAVYRIAKRHGATFVSADMPGDGPRFWFSARNMGHPFDNALARAVFLDLKLAGHLNEAGNLKLKRS